ncbi:MAG TPA: M20/M25/M40 family metallo-hydrolase, partial [Longimicrobiales bacterium]|nr:M20/M25/M40 family metallo-hydrolase [Longimicrobiales bacterium]
AIPREAWVELEVRSEAEVVLDDLDVRVRGTARHHAPEASGLVLSVESIGRRPAAATLPDEPLVKAAVAATSALGGEAELSVSSTDANIPMTLGIPAITMGAGGEAGQAHTPDEWYRNVGGPDGVVRVLLTLLLADDPDR